MWGILPLIILLTIWTIFKLFNKPATSLKPRELTEEEQKQFHYSCLYNALVLFAATPEYLESLAGPVFDPLTEIESDFEYAFGDYIFEQNFKNNFVKEEMRIPLLQFKDQVDALPSNLWTWESLKTDSEWISLRKSADEVLNRIGDKRREYDFSFTTTITVDT